MGIILMRSKFLKLHKMKRMLVVDWEEWHFEVELYEDEEEAEEEDNP